jgi:hypothetical protein
MTMPLDHTLQRRQAIAFAIAASRGRRLSYIGSLGVIARVSRHAR